MLLYALTETAQHPPEEWDGLLRAIGNGSRDALADLYHLARVPVYTMALSLLKSKHDAEDVVQDTFLQVWNAAAGYQARGKGLAWILTIARNLARMKFREQSRSGELSEEGWASLVADSPALTTEDKEVLSAALNTLSDQERQVVTLHAVTGLKHREIAQLLELPLSTVLSKYRRALGKLKHELEGADLP